MPIHEYYDSESEENEMPNHSAPFSNGNHIIIYLKCNCAIVSPIDANTQISTSYYCTHCDKYQSVLATVRHLCA